jgi:cytochrome c biogenesis protein
MTFAEYETNRVHQFYSNLSILDNYGNEVAQQTISVNNPLRYKNVDFIKVIGITRIRVKDKNEKIKYEFPFPLKKVSKSWITWITSSNGNEILVFDQLQNSFLLMMKPEFFKSENVGRYHRNLSILDILPSTGLLIKYDPSIQIIYFGFGLLMLTACFSYLPYTQIWILIKRKILG